MRWAASLRIASCVLWLGGACVLAAELGDEARELARLNEDAQRAFQEHNYEKGAELYRQLIFRIPGEANPHYNYACALARLGRMPEALAALEMAVSKGFNDPDHVQQDDDLASLRAEARFARCVEKARENARASEPPYDEGASIPGVKTIEGAPEGGLRFRLRMSPSASAEKPDRLIVWLHPAGGSANQAVEAMAERFVKLGYALLVPTQKDWRFWSGPDLDKLWRKTLPEVAKTPGLDAARPILMGYSAGGQAALLLWQAEPGNVGGLVLDAAYPVRPRPDGKGFDAMPLPNHPAARRTPVFVLVGEKDPGGQVWQKVEPEWRQAGVPLTLRTVPGQGHAWLFGPKQTDELFVWLEQVKAGKLPRDAQSEPPKEGTK